MAFEPLFDPDSLKLLLTMDYTQAAQVCAKMLGVRSEAKIDATLKAISGSGMNPWSVAIYGGPATWEKLGVHGPSVHRMRLAEATAVPGGVALGMPEATFSEGNNLVLPVVSVGGYIIHVCDMVDVVFPVLTSIKHKISVRNSSAAFPALVAAKHVSAYDATVHMAALKRAETIEMGAKGVIYAPALVEVNSLEIRNKRILAKLLGAVKAGTRDYLSTVVANGR